jgi:hypothetical protein
VPDPVTVTVTVAFCAALLGEMEVMDCAEAQTTKVTAKK